MKKQPDQKPRYWRSLDELQQTPRFVAAREREFPPEAAELSLSAVDRRRFLGLMGATSALAGVTLSGCVRKPRETIVPYSSRPEDLIPGKPRFFATSAFIAGGVQGLLVENQDGRPTKIEGNPRHPMSQGRSTAQAQAEVLELYDPDRSASPLYKGKTSTWKAFFEFADKHFAGLARGKGQGLALLVEQLPSPTRQYLLAEFTARFPAARIYLHDAAHAKHTAAGAAMVGAAGVLPRPALEHADVVLVLDADPLGGEGDVVRASGAFASRRVVRKAGDAMNRLYVAEPFFTVTGGAADHRLRLRASEVGPLLAALAARLVIKGVKLPAGAERLSGALKQGQRHEGRRGKWIAAVAADLASKRGKALIMVGERQPPRVHGLAWLLNVALGALAPDGPLQVARDEAPGAPNPPGLPELNKAITGGAVKTLVALGGNPAYSAPADLKFSAALKQVPTLIHLSSQLDETSRLAAWHLPRSHFLEAWGDLRASDGTVSIQQPLIAPLRDSRSEIELLARLTKNEFRRGYMLVQAHWSGRAGYPDQFEKRWRRWLHDGVAERGELAAPTLNWSKLDLGWISQPAPAASKDSLELNLRLDAKVFDGRYANNGWLQELPDPVTKLTWDNAAHISPATARELGLESFQMLELSLGGRSLKAAAFVIPGCAEHSLTLALGYGRRAGGKVADGAGFDAFALQSSAAPHFAGGLTVKRAGKRRYLLASTQDHWSMEGRPIIREGSLAQFSKDPEFAHKMNEHPPLKHIWTPPNETAGHQWGMSIDQTLCTGCNACVVACQAENNISVVGKRRVLEGREMHWIRIDRYFIGSEDDPRMAVQPMGCQHCELAPCESVCPVAATVHSPEGLNDMAYNRCIGTRYCLNNCPYKVRRFNFFQYNKDLPQVSRMQKNPDVTLRFRGVMEKCTFCVQRIQEAKIKAKREGDGVVRDGDIVPACVQACPSKAIVFGDVNDKDSEVSKHKRRRREYGVLEELNNRPRTSYAARLRNLNADLKEDLE